MSFVEIVATPVPHWGRRLPADARRGDCRHKDAFPGLVDVPASAKMADGSWTHIWVYDSEESARYANAHADDIAVCTAWVNHLSDDDDDHDGVVEGYMPAGGYSPLSFAR